MPARAANPSTKSRQISVRVLSETDAWLERRAGGHQNKAGLIRRLIEAEMAREKKRDLLEMFDRAAGDLTDEDHEERESLLGGFAANDRADQGT